ncbi:hypothetical protein AQUCO_05000009v1 [Aquilegia coerulea]|uniref:Factor of DNA methylation 1-5/IDN2 domain-containing protein n=1 Tax=Aquilegia coerulea TaxID=218851 RepID=A0A2G5CKH1_AQUCA|nr:hypothetical protein AQUCO_05000009v1 [Aquilegia coerulea]
MEVNSSDEVNALVNRLKEKDEELEHLKNLNQILLMKERTSNDELVEAHKILINGWKAFSDKIYAVGIKRMGELDPKPFKDACYKKYQITAVAEEKALRLCSLWQSRLTNPSWHPFKVVQNGSGEAKEIINEDDEQLKKLKRKYGSEVYVSVCQALKEVNEHNPSGRYPVGVLWDYKENKRATLKEAIDIILKMKMVPS